MAEKEAYISSRPHLRSTSLRSTLYRRPGQRGAPFRTFHRRKHGWLAVRNAAKAETEASRAHPEAANDAGEDNFDGDNDDDEEELFDEWAPGRIRATPERPLFTPTPSPSPKRSRWSY